MCWRIEYLVSLLNTQYLLSLRPDTSALSNKYLYNDKELQDEMGLNGYDYGARMYDPTVVKTEATLLTLSMTWLSSF